MRRRKNARAAMVAGALAASLAWNYGGGGSASEARAGETWDGGGANDNWLTANNWSPNGAPINNGTANISFAGAIRLTPNLNTNYSINSMFFGPTAGAFVLDSATNNILTIGAGGIGHQDNSNQTVNHDITLAAAQTWATASTGGLIVNGNIVNGGNTLIVSGSGITLAGAISGTGGLTKNSGTQTIDGTSANTYTGVTTVNAGDLLLSKSVVVNGAIAGTLVIGDGVGGVGVDRVILQGPNQIANTAPVTINTSGVLDLNNFNDAIGTLTMTGGSVDATGAGGLLTVTGGSIATHAHSATATISGALRLGAATTATVGDGTVATDLNIPDVVSESVVGAALTKGGAGTMRLGSANTFTGGLRINAGTAIVSDNAAAGTGTLTLAGGAIETDDGSTLTNPVTLLNATTSSVTGIFTMHFDGVVSGSGGLQVNCDDSSTVALVLGGAAANTQNGAVTVVNGGLTLSKPAGTNALAGTLNIGDGIGSADTASLQQTANDQFANASDVNINTDGRWLLNVGNRSEQIDTLTLIGGGHVSTGTGVLTVGGNITVNDGVGAAPAIAGNLNLGASDCIVNVTGTEQLQMQAVVTNGSITKNGPGALTMLADNSFAGGVTLTQGTIFIAAATTPLGTGVVTLNGGTLRPSNANRTIANNIQIFAPSFVNTTGANLTFSGVITGNDELMKIGDDTLRLNGASPAYTGEVQVQEGILFVGANNALGSTATGTVVSSGATLEWVGNYTSPEPLTITSDGPGDIGAMRSTNGLFAGPITIPTSATISAYTSGGGTIELSGGITVNGAGGVTFDGDSNTLVSSLISGVGLVRKTGDGTLSLKHSNNTYGGTTQINNGTLEVPAGISNAIPDTSAVSLGNVAGTTLLIGSGNVETIGSLSGSGTAGGVVVLENGAELRIGADGTSTTFGGRILSLIAGGPSGITKVGTGALTLSGNNAFGGVTGDQEVDVLGGMLRVSGGSAIPDDKVIRLANTAGVVFELTGAETIGGLTGGGPIGGNLNMLANLTINTNANAAFNGVISGNGQLIKAGNGLLAINLNNTYTGRTIINGGTLSIVDDSSLGNLPMVVGSNHLTLDGGQIFAAANMTLNALRGITLGAAGGTIGAAGTFNVPARILGSGSLLISGDAGFGAIVLSASNGFSGDLLIHDGTLAIAEDANLGGVPGAFDPDRISIFDATLRWTSNSAGITANRGITVRSDKSKIEVIAGVTLNVNSLVSGGAADSGLRKRGPGTLRLNGGATYTGLTRVEDGKLVFTQSMTTSSDVTVTTTGTLELAQSGGSNIVLKTGLIAPQAALGRIDIKNNKAVLTAQSVGTFNGTSYDGVTGLIARSYNFSAWSGPGIMTSLPDAIAGLTTVAVATADETGYAGSTFGGVPVGSGNVLVMYTYAGDLNLDGLVDAADYGLIDNFVQFPGSFGYANGDINFDGIIDAGDYGIIDNTIQLQGPPIPVNAAPLSGVTAVPEPAAMSVITLLSALAMQGRRRRRR